MHEVLVVIFCTGLASACFAQPGSLMPELPERQDAQALPPLAVMLASVDTFYAAQTTIQAAEIAKSKKYRWLAYMPNPGCSPFLGGFNVTLNLAAPLQEIRLKHTIRQKVKYLDLANNATARDLKNEVTADYYKDDKPSLHFYEKGGKYLYKSHNFLCPPALANYIAENISDDKDSRISLVKNFLVNLDELSSLAKHEINSLKAVFSKNFINERLPYDRKNSIIPRISNFIGSTNPGSRDYPAVPRTVPGERPGRRVYERYPNFGVPKHS